MISCQFVSSTLNVPKLEVCDGCGFSIVPRTNRIYTRTVAFYVTHNSNHKWYYLSRQTPDEVILIKCYDSEVDRARLSPHSAFPDTVWSTKDDPLRESIEIRALLFDSE